MGILIFCTGYIQFTEVLALSYKQWAYVEFTGRNDWDSRLLQQNRSFFYPAANFSIILSDAIPSLKSSNLISYAKVRRRHLQIRKCKS
jgi:hypothetical protein